jgi:hypothetical protein
LGGAQTLAGAGGGAPALASNPADPSGLTAAAWEEGGQIRVSRRLGSGAFGVPGGPSDADASDPAISLNPRGTVFLGWLVDGDGARAQAGSTAPVTLAGSGASAPVVASDGVGDGVEVFLLGGQVFIFGFDGAPPTLTSVGVPPIAPAGSPVGMSAAAFDIWAGTPTVAWSFGDGGAATGASTAHTYATPGIYTVTLQAADGAGNAAAQTRQIAVVFPDRDGDRFPSNLDCNDNAAKIHPGARDIPGDRIDQDCNGKDAPFPRVAATISFSYVGAGAGHFRVTQLVVKGANRRAKITVRCSGHPRCTFKSKRGPSIRKGRANLLAKLSRGQRIFRTGQTLDVRVTRKGFIGKVQRIRFGEIRPSSRTLCLKPGSSRPRNRC